MKSFIYDGKTEIIALSFEPGDLLREGICAACKEHDIKVGAIISGIGVLKTASLHHVEHTSFPPNDILYKVDKPFEMLSVNGMIVDYIPHIHISLSCSSPNLNLSSGDEVTFGGHLEDGAVVGYLSEIVIMKFNSFDIKRIKHHKYKIDQLENSKNKN